jgi:lipopolysaccharide export system permease protein
MTLMQRHMFLRLLAYAGMVTLVFTIVVMLVTTSRLFQLMAQGAMPLGRFSLALATLLPMQLYLDVPLTVTIAVIFAYHEWIRHNEILSLRNAGLTNRALAMPALAAGAVGMLFTALMSLYLLPISFRIFEDIRYNAGYYNLTANVLYEGYLQTIAPNLSLSFHKRIASDAIEGVTVLDARTAGSLTYIFADRGRFVTQDAKLEPERVILLEHGSYIVRHDPNEKVTPINFDDLVVPLTTSGDTPKTRQWRGYFEERIDSLLNPPPEVRMNPADYGQWIAEGHKRILMPILCLSYVLFTLGVLLRFHYYRSSGVFHILGIAAAVAFWHGLFVVTHSLVTSSPSLAAIYYVVAATPAVVGIALLLSARFSLRRKRQPPAPPWEPLLDAQAQTGNR